MSVKQVIVVRKKFPTAKQNESSKLRTGKYVAQGAHAVSNVFFDRISEKSDDFIKIDVTPEMLEWLFNERRTKITVGVEDEDELLEIYEAAKAADLPVSLITDAGLTEFNGVPTKTALAIGPAKSEDIDKITGHLSLF